MHPAIRETLAYLDEEYLELLNGRCPRHPAGGPGCWHDATDEELRRLDVAVTISPTLALCEAFLTGEAIPMDRLDRAALKRYGRRP